MKYLIPILLLMTTFTVFSQNQSLPVLKMYKSDKSVTITPLKEIDSLVHATILPVNLVLLGVKNIANTSALCEARIISRGEGTLAQFGFCWSTTQNPTISANKVNGTLIDSINFSNTIYSLTNNTKYYARAFAYNELGISYSNQIEFSVNVSIVPVNLTFRSVKNITDTTASFEATILSKGGGTLGEIGFCWSTTQNPTISANKVKGSWKDSINFLNTISSLNKNTKYYAKAYAYNELGISYSNQIEFSTLNKQDSLLEIVKIGTQIWQPKNLDVSKYKNGDSIRYASTRGEWMDAADKKEGAWCYYDHEPQNGEVYGKLYNWYAVNDKRGLATKGFHIPTDAEWSVLTDYLGGEQTSGFKMKSTSGWKNNGNGNNISGFNGMPGGYCNNGGNFNGITGDEYFWSSSESSTDDAWNRGLNSYSLRVDRNHGNKSDGLYVRCLRD